MDGEGLSGDMERVGGAGGIGDPEPFADLEAAAGVQEGVPLPVREAADEEGGDASAGRADQEDARPEDPGVVEVDRLPLEVLGKVAEPAVFPAAVPMEDEEPGLVAAG